jgi:hypothetical protein
MFLRKIKDIRISNNEISTVRDASISVEELERQISQLNYEGRNKPKDKGVETARLPPFIQAFYYNFFAYLKVPTAHQVYSTYLSWLGGAQNGLVQIDGVKYKTDAIQYRFIRTYPSLIRDLHFLYLLQESNLFESIEYSMEQDYYNGLDIKIDHNEKTYFVSLFIDTQRSTFYKRRKTIRHDYSEVHEIELKVNFSSLSTSGKIYLLNQTHINKLAEEILKK